MLPQMTWSDPEHVREYQKAYQRAYRQSGKKSQKDAEYYQRNKERLLRQVAERWAELSPKERSARTATTYRRRKAKAENDVARRRARKRGAYREDIDRQVVWERDEGLCGICGKPADGDNWHLDHAIPLGPGDHSYANVQVAHPKCNVAKGTEDKQVLAEWYGDA